MPYNLDFLDDRGRRPFDEVLKRCVREPGVARELFSIVMPVGWSDEVPDVIEWLDGQLQPKQRTWNTDTIGTLADGSILHIEQETSNHDDMHERMMDYASLIATTKNLRGVRQIYLCTGPSSLLDTRTARKSKATATQSEIPSNFFTQVVSMRG